MSLTTLNKAQEKRRACPQTYVLPYLPSVTNVKIRKKKALKKKSKPKDMFTFEACLKTIDAHINNSTF